MITWRDGAESEFHYLWLGDNCSTAFHPDTGERSFELLKVCDNIRPANISQSRSTLKILRDTNQHECYPSFSWLYEHCYSNKKATHCKNSYINGNNNFYIIFPALIIMIL